MWVCAMFGVPFVFLSWLVFSNSPFTSNSSGTGEQWCRLNMRKKDREKEIERETERKKQRTKSEAYWNLLSSYFFWLMFAKLVDDVKRNESERPNGMFEAKTKTTSKNCQKSQRSWKLLEVYHLLLHKMCIFYEWMGSFPSLIFIC